MCLTASIQRIEFHLKKPAVIREINYELFYLGIMERGRENPIALDQFLHAKNARKTDTN